MLLSRRHHRTRAASGAGLTFALVALLTLALVTPLTTLDGGRAASAAAAPDERPNIILFMTDDQNRNELRWMPKTRAALKRHGVTFTEALAPAPLCCPSRAMVATGQYGHNNGVVYNDGPYGGYEALRGKQNTLARWLHDGGYQTALVGKYLNGYAGRNPPPQRGWTAWHPAVIDIYRYVGTSFLEGDTVRRYRRNITPVIADYTDDLVRSFSADPAPFFLWVSHVAPHGAVWDREDGTAYWGPPRPAATHAAVLGDVALPSLARRSFNSPGVGPQPYPARAPVSVPWIQDYFTERLRTLQDVDDAVERLIATLEETGELDNTYVFFVSDNGHLLGEHRLVQKNVLYREALAIPLVVRVPGATPSTSSRPVTIVDLAPTIAELAGVEPQRVVDGRSFVPLLRGQPLRWRDTQLVLTGGTRTVGPLPGWEYRGVRTHRYTFMRRAVDGVEFLFDRRRHPEENVNVASARRYRAVRLELRERLQALAVCSAEDCWRRFGRMPPLPPAR